MCCLRNFRINPLFHFEVHQELSAFVMNCFLFPLYIIVVAFTCFPLQAQLLPGNHSDHQALLEFRAKITGDQFGFMFQWNQTVHFCRWHGVTCGRHHQRVTKLELQSLNLAGRLSPYIGNLSFLRVLNLWNNSFSGAIPQEIGHLHRLQELHLSNNSLNGPIPSNLSGCYKLISFVASDNLLDGNIPASLGTLRNLKEINLRSNKLSQNLPPSLGNLSSLKVLNLGSNYLTGETPKSFGQLSSLTALGLQENALSGMIPLPIFNVSSIRDISVAVNRLEGELPSNLGNTMPNLRSFKVSFNNFSGQVPFSIANATNLLDFEVENNSFTGNLPSLKDLTKLQRFIVGLNFFGNDQENGMNFICPLVNATELNTLTVNQNNLGGVLPKCISNFSTSLTILDVSLNDLISNIPDGIGNLANLEWLVAAGNQLSGHIPSSIGSILKLHVVELEGNYLSGNIPSTFGSLKSLTQLQLWGNSLNGNIPASLGNCTLLQVVDLADNNLSGLIPPQIFNISSLSIRLDLSGNHLSGVLPMEVGNLRTLTALYVRENLLSGQVPNSLGGCASLEVLDMGDNSFQGVIPGLFVSLKGMRELNISHNKFVGQIPPFLSRLKLELLDLSYNDLEGTIPTEGIFKNASAALLIGNHKLCGGIAEYHMPKCHFLKPSNERKLSFSARLAICLISAILLVGLLLSLFMFFLRKRKRKESTSTNDDELSLYLKLSYHNLVKATNWFSPNNVVGTGGFGSVYKGILELDQGVKMYVAIKVFNLLCQGASRSFVAECEALRSIRHRNLVKILTVCSGVDAKGNDFKALVYEFMSNGSLEEWLHPKDCSLQRSGPLNIDHRVSIAIDVATALDYLHHLCGTPVVHCDVKPSNILLDEDMVAHLGDFGLVKFLKETMETSSSSEAGTGSITIRGSIGYTAPEYGMGSEPSTEGDVYSFGVLLLEMFTGRRPTDDVFQDGLNIHNFTKAALSEIDHALKIIDPTLLCEDQEMGEGHKKRTEECLITILGLGAACCDQLPKERMNITHVVAQLVAAKHSLLQPYN